MAAQAIVHFVRNGGVTSVSRLKAQMRYLGRFHLVDGAMVPIPARTQVDLHRSRRYFEDRITPTAETFDDFAQGFLEATGRLRPNGHQELTSHIVASFPEGVDRQLAQTIASEFVWELFNHPDGEEDGQEADYDDGYDYFTAFHNDTDNPHIHLIVNRDPFARVHELDGAEGHLSTRHLNEWLRISHRNPDINWDSMRERLARVARRHGVDLVATPHEERGGERGGMADQPLTQAEYWRRRRENINFEVVDGGIDYEPPQMRGAIQSSNSRQAQIVMQPGGGLGVERPQSGGHQDGSSAGGSGGVLGAGPDGTAPVHASGAGHAGQSRHDQHRRAPARDQDVQFEELGDIYDATPPGSPRPEQPGVTSPPPASGSGGGSIETGNDGGTERRTESDRRRGIDAQPGEQVDRPGRGGRRGAAHAGLRGEPMEGVEGHPQDRPHGGGDNDRDRNDEPAAQAGGNQVGGRRRRTEVDLLTEGQHPLADSDQARGVETRGQKRKRAEMEAARRIGGEPSTHEMEMRKTRARQERQQRIQREARKIVRQNEKAPRRPGRGPNGGNGRSAP